MTSPRRCENQRVATVAPSTIAVSPVPNPTTTPQNRIELPDCRHAKRTGDAGRDQRERHGRDKADPEAVHEAGREGAHEAEQHQADRQGGRDLGCATSRTPSPEA